MAVTVETVVYDFTLEESMRDAYVNMIARLRARIAELNEDRNALVREYTGQMQAATLPKKVLKLSLKLSELVFQLDQEIYGLEGAVTDLEADLAGLEPGPESNELLPVVTDREEV